MYLCVWTMVRQSDTVAGGLAWHAVHASLCVFLAVRLRVGADSAPRLCACVARTCRVCTLQRASSVPVRRMGCCCCCVHAGGRVLRIVGFALRRVFVGWRRRAARALCPCVLALPCTFVCLLPRYGAADFRAAPAVLRAAAATAAVAAALLMKTVSPDRTGFCSGSS